MPSNGAANGRREGFGAKDALVEVIETEIEELLFDHDVADDLLGRALLCSRGHVAMPYRGDDVAGMAPYEGPASS